MKLEKYDIDFYSNVSGIPCGIAIISYRPGTNHIITSRSLEPNAEESIEFVITDRKGYEASWLSIKASQYDMNRIENEAIRFIKNNNYYGDYI